MIKDDTICAMSSPPGTGAIAVVRLSGKDAVKICDNVFFSAKKSKKLKAQKANTIHLGTLRDKDTVIDEVLVSIFQAPNSYTGEDVIEVSCHGALYIQQKILQLFINKGARLAKPGEFTLRAFLNRKLDLSQAEAVADLIASTSEASHKLAIQQMRGGFSDELKILRKKLLNFISLIELELDFSEENVEFADKPELKKLVNSINNFIKRLISSFDLGNVIKNGVPVAIIGEPNVGKSTLLNVLLNEDKAIVSEIPGTTRDAIEDNITIEGISFRFIDTAGLRDTTDKIETLGVEKTFQKIHQASIVLLLVDAQDSIEVINKAISKLKSRITDTSAKVIVVVNKIDKLNKKQINEKFQTILSDKDTFVFISAKKLINIEHLTDCLLKTLNLSSLSKNDVIVTNVRHYEALVKSSEAVSRVLDGLKNNISGDFLATDIREVLHYLGEITGEITTDEILGNIFEKFCIGK